MKRREFLSKVSILGGGCVFFQCAAPGFVIAEVNESGVCSGRRPLTINGEKIITIDVHGHTMFPQVDTLVETAGSGSPEARDEPEEVNVPDRSGGGDAFDAIGAGMTDIDRRLRHMDATGVDIQVISPSPGQFNYAADPGLAEQIVQVQNEGMAELVDTNPDRFAAVGTLSMQHPDLAIEQIQDGAGRLGLKGFMIGARIGEYDLSDQKFEPVWAKAVEANTVIFIHPLGSIYRANDRFMKFNLAFVAGTPLEETFAVSHLIFGGVLDRHPRLKICVAHGGGYLPYYMGRSDNCHQSNEECRSMKQAPSDYLRQLHYDSRVFKSQTLRHLVDVAGASQIMLGTDYPFPVQNPDPTDFICSTPGLSSQEIAAILGRNAVGFYSL